MPRSSGGARITSSDQLADGVVTSPKMDLTDLGQSVIPTASFLHSLGTVAKRWNNLVVTDATISRFAGTSVPVVNGTQDWGSSSAAWATIYVNDIQGDARALIFAGI